MRLYDHNTLCGQKRIIVTAIERTAYPGFPRAPQPNDLIAYCTPSA